ncbi:MAG: peptidoglycan-binding protein, partial [Clostridia bacterium]|nr:peptidoglycan-binding protein [Clostridia bacterium]
ASKMQHIGFYIGGGYVIHCSKEVKRQKIGEYPWTHYGIPKGLGGDVPVPTHKTIRKGSTGPEVVECQEDLIQLNYDLSPYGADGKFGAKTESAVKAFQTASGLKADGIVGPLTWAALDAAVGPQPEPGPQLYTVTIPHLTEEQAEELLKQYPDAEKKAEGGGSR